VLLFLIKIAGVTAGFVLADQISDTLYTEMHSATMLFDESDPTNPATIAWTKTQTKLRCCGIDGVDSWRGNAALYAVNGSLPQSCCVFPSHCCGCNRLNVQYDYRYQARNQEQLYTSGCVWSNKYPLQTLLTALGGVSAAVALLELILVLLGICLACCVRHCDKNTLSGCYSTNAYGGDVTTKRSAMSTFSKNLLQPLLPESF
jgi:hypothetical protein